MPVGALPGPRNEFGVIPLDHLDETWRQRLRIQERVYKGTGILLGKGQDFVFANGIVGFSQDSLDNEGRKRLPPQGGSPFETALLVGGDPDIQALASRLRVSMA